MINAKKLRDSMPAPQEPVPLTEYLGQRIADSAARGYDNTKAWVENDKVKDAQRLLELEGYQSEVLITEDRRSQILIKW